jgi:hypothetical protein
MERKEAVVVKGIVPISQTWVRDAEIRLKLSSPVPIFRQTNKWNEVQIAIER